MSKVITEIFLSSIFKIFFFSGLKKAYALLFDGQLRRTVLQLLSILAIGDHDKLTFRIIPEIVGVLTLCGGTASLDSEDLKIRKGICIPFTNPFFFNFKKNLFRYLNNNMSHI